MASSRDLVATATEKTTVPLTFGTTQVPPSSSPQPPSLDSDVSGARIVIVMGVSGTGKSTLGAALSNALRLPFIDGDDLHPVANVAKMSRGEPLSDADRRPWLDAIRETVVAHVRDQLGTDHAHTPGVVVACSSLKKAYRAALRGEGVPWTQTQGPSSGSTSNTRFVYLEGDRDILMARMLNRRGHFMKADMLESQLNTLESPEGEPGVVTVPVDMSTGDQVRRVVETLGLQGEMCSMSSLSS